MRVSRLLALIALVGTCEHAVARADAEWGLPSSERNTGGSAEQGGEWGGSSAAPREWGGNDGGMLGFAGESGPDERLENKLNAGITTPEERTAMTRSGIKRDPRLQISEYVNTLGPAGGAPSLANAQVQLLTTPELEKLFPEWMFYVLRFPRWPVAMAPPEGLSHSNLFIVKKTGRMSLIAGQDELQAFFTQTQTAKSDSQARVLVYVWLQLVTELIQDGMYKFNMLDDTVSVSTKETEMLATGKASVNKEAGNTGDVSVTLIFDGTGKIKGIEEKNTVQPGIRPICQSTKLLDDDDLVRRMAERDLLIMGKYALPYLAEQRPKLSTELQHAVDEIVVRINQEARYA